MPTTNSYNFRTEFILQEVGEIMDPHFCHHFCGFAPPQPSYSRNSTSRAKLVPGAIMLKLSEGPFPPPLGHQRHGGGFLKDPRRGVNVADTLAIPGTLRGVPEQRVVRGRMFMLQLTKGNGIRESFK